MLDIHQEVLSAERRIRAFIRKTPLEYAFDISTAIGCSTFLKLENLQHTGSFKVRGALNKLLSLNTAERKAGVIAASTGNHGLAVAYGMHQLGIKGSLFLPQNTSPQKIRLLRRYPVDLHFHGRDCGGTENFAKAKAHELNRVYLSPYNDPRIIGGQGTIAVELMQQLVDVDCIVASVGGGGLISGIAGYVKAIEKDIEIIGCLPENSPAMLDAVIAGKVVKSKILPTLSDGTAGGIDNNTITLNPCKTYVDRWVRVNETDIVKGLKTIFQQHRWVVEGAAGVAAAGLFKIKEDLKGKKVALIICGGNIDMDVFKQLVF